MKQNSFLKFAKLAAKIADDKKGIDTVILNVSRHTPIADYFIITTVESHPQMNAIIHAIQESFQKLGIPHPIHRDGRLSSSWSVLDYGGLIIHIMSPEARDFYSIEKVWSMARKVNLKN